MALQMLCTAGDHWKRPPSSAQHRSAHLLHSPPAHRCCNHLHGGNVRKCWFLGTAEKEAVLTLSICRGRVTDTFCTHMTGLFADIFCCCPAFGARWGCIGSTEPNVGFDSRAGTDTSTAAASEQFSSSFFTCSIPLLTTQHSRRTHRH